MNGRNDSSDWHDAALGRVLEILAIVLMVACGAALANVFLW